jgi:hypothetical protein
MSIPKEIEEYFVTSGKVGVSLFYLLGNWVSPNTPDTRGWNWLDTAVKMTTYLPCGYHLPSFSYNWLEPWTIIYHHLPIKWPPFPYPLPSFPVESPTTHQVFRARPRSILLLLGWPYLHQAYQQSALDSNVKMVLPAMPQLVPKNRLEP